MAAKDLATSRRCASIESMHVRKSPVDLPCIALENPDMAFVFQHAKVGDKVIILP
jgi:hypothetical protein